MEPWKVLGLHASIGRCGILLRRYCQETVEADEGIICKDCLILFRPEKLVFMTNLRLREAWCSLPCRWWLCATGLSRRRGWKTHSYSARTPHALLWQLAGFWIRASLGNDKMLTSSQCNGAEIRNWDLNSAFLLLLLRPIATMASGGKYFECFCTLSRDVTTRFFGRFF